MKYKITSIIPPGFVTLNDQKYIVPGWVPVEDHITFSDVIHDPILKRISKPERQEFTVLGSKGAEYRVSVTNQRFTCTCPAGQFRGRCKHIDQIKSKIEYDIINK